MAQLSPQEVDLIRATHVARLATADARGVPHVIPICFAYDGEHLYSVLDLKPKRTSLTRLRRVRNILSNPNVALVLDYYDEDWTRLWYILVTGTAKLIQEGEEHQRAIGLLRAKYPQYHNMDIDENPMIRITPEKITSWGDLPQEENGQKGLL